jgi:hypothetical protein
MRARLYLPVILLLLGSAVARADELVSLATRDGVTQTYLLAYNKGESYRAVAILFPGGDGFFTVRQAADGDTTNSVNFVVRTRGMFASNGVAAAAVTGPSDASRMTDGFRMSDQHATDIAAVVADVKKRFPGARVFLVGTSRGTVSAAYTGLALGDKVDGVVLTSTVFNANKAGGGVAGVDFSKFKVPLLFVHHREDACNVCPYNAAQRLADRFPLISVSGGLPPQSGPCDPLSAHGYFGKEAEAVAAIANWITGKPFEKDVK